MSPFANLFVVGFNGIVAARADTWRPEAFVRKLVQSVFLDSCMEMDASTPSR